MSTIQIGNYTGFHECTIPTFVCLGEDCMSSWEPKIKPKSKLNLIGHSYWKCKPCQQKEELLSLANTIYGADKQRLELGQRLEKLYQGSKYIPLPVSKPDKNVIDRFKLRGGCIKYK